MISEIKGIKFKMKYFIKNNKPLFYFIYTLLNIIIFTGVFGCSGKNNKQLDTMNDYEIFLDKKQKIEKKEDLVLTEKNYEKLGDYY